MTLPKMDDKDIERMIDIIGDGELSARRRVWASLSHGLNNLSGPTYVYS